MKKLLTALMTASAMLLTMAPLTGAAELDPPRHDPADYDLIEYGGLYYDLVNTSYAQDSYGVWGVKDTDATSFTIPEEINGKPVMIRNPSDYAFSDCKNLQNIFVEGDDRDGWYSIDGVLCKDDMLVCYPCGRTGDYTVPGRIHTISQNAFYNASVGKLTLQSSMSISHLNLCQIDEIETKGADNKYDLTLNGESMPGGYGLKKITLDGIFTQLHITGEPELESLTFTPESLIYGSVLIERCEKLRELRIAECTMGLGAPSLTVNRCDNLEYLSFYNGFLGMRKYMTVNTEQLGTRPLYQDTVFINTCMALKEVEIFATPYITSYDKVRVSYCPALEKVTFHELPQSAMWGKEPDPYYTPLSLDGVAGDFTVYGRDTNKGLKNWCTENGYPFEALATAIELGDVTGDTIVNASDAALILNAAAKTGAGEASPLMEEQQSVADVNSDSAVNASDAALILQYSAASGSGQFKGTIAAYLAEKAA